MEKLQLNKLFPSLLYVKFTKQVGWKEFPIQERGGVKLLYSAKNMSVCGFYSAYTMISNLFWNSTLNLRQLYPINLFGLLRWLSVCMCHPLLPSKGRLLNSLLHVENVAFFDLEPILENRWTSGSKFSEIAFVISVFWSRKRIFTLRYQNLPNPHQVYRQREIPIHLFLFHLTQERTVRRSSRMFCTLIRSKQVYSSLLMNQLNTLPSYPSTKMSWKIQLLLNQP